MKDPTSVHFPWSDPLLLSNKSRAVLAIVIRRSSSRFSELVSEDALYSSRTNCLISHRGSSSAIRIHSLTCSMDMYMASKVSWNVFGYVLRGPSHLYCLSWETRTNQLEKVEADASYSCNLDLHGEPGAIGRAGQLPGDDHELFVPGRAFASRFRHAAVPNNYQSVFPRPFVAWRQDECLSILKSGQFRLLSIPSDLYHQIMHTIIYITLRREHPTSTYTIHNIHMFRCRLSTATPWHGPCSLLHWFNM